MRLAADPSPTPSTTRALPSIVIAALHSNAMMPTPLLTLRRSSRFCRASGAAEVSAERPPDDSSEVLRAPRKRKATAPAAAKQASADEPRSRFNKKATQPSKAAAAALTHAPRTREEAAWKAGIPLVVGTDEAGRGPLAGPVVAAACALPADLAPILGIGDSKTIVDEEVREELYEKIVSAPGVVWSARIVGAARIDEINILMASLEAMRLSVVDVLEALPRDRALVCVDGPFSPWKEGAKYANFQEPPLPEGTDVTIEPITKGDAKVYCIAAASIIAKVTRDRAMRLYDAEWPMYDLKGHKGYPTPSHVAAISKHGACAIHRRTFAPLKTRTLPVPTAKELALVESLAATLATGDRAKASE